MRSPPQSRASRGFTLIELLVVMAVLGVLLSLAAPRYIDHVQRSRETVLRHNLAGLREAIDRFYADQARYPADLMELVARRYLREVPVDPMTDRADTWVLLPPSGQTTAVFDVRSGAPGAPSQGPPYASW
jgi:general secretion pathway protein G